MATHELPCSWQLQRLSRPVRRSAPCLGITQQTPAVTHHTQPGLADVRPAKQRPTPAGPECQVIAYRPPPRPGSFRPLAGDLAHARVPCMFTQDAQDVRVHVDVRAGSQREVQVRVAAVLLREDDCGPGQHLPQQLDVRWRCQHVVLACTRSRNSERLCMRPILIS